MRLLDVLSAATSHLQAAGVDNPRLDAEVMLSSLLGLERIQLYVSFDRPLYAEELTRYREMVAKRAKRIPVAYITGTKEFMGLDLAVNRSVLIPRPETEHLVEAVVSHLAADHASFNGQRILEMCTGSGAIAVSLAAQLPDATILATDISQEALQVAGTNIRRHGVEARVHLVRSDMFDRLPLPRLASKFDAVVSNPPYIATSEVASLAPEIRLYEPRLALDGGSDGLRFYRVLVDRAWEYLRLGGILAMEIGSSQANSVLNLIEASSHYGQTVIQKDLAGLDRVIKTCRLG